MVLADRRDEASREPKAAALRSLIEASGSARRQWLHWIPHEVAEAVEWFLPRPRRDLDRVGLSATSPCRGGPGSGLLPGVLFRAPLGVLIEQALTEPPCDGH